MKFFLVISIIAVWWVPVNSPGNIDITNLPLSNNLIQTKTKTSNFLQIGSRSMTKRKMDHFGFQNRRQMLLYKRN